MYLRFIFLKIFDFKWFIKILIIYMTHVLTQIICITHAIYKTHIIYIAHMVKLIFKAYERKLFYNSFSVYKSFNRYYQKHKEKLSKKARERYKNLSEEEKYWYKNLLENEKQRLAEYMKNYM